MMHQHPASLAASAQEIDPQYRRYHEGVAHDLREAADLIEGRK